MKHFIILLSALLITGCGMADNNTGHNLNSNESSNTNVDSSDSFALPKEVIDVIKKHYHVEESELLKVEIIDSINYISVIHHEYLQGESEPIFPPVEIGIPKATNLKGDINSDGKFDLIISVDYSGGGSDLIWDDIFIFINDGQDNFILAGEPQTDESICECNDGGLTGSCQVKKITNGMIDAISYCYSDEDANCCPSFEYAVSLKYEKGKLVMSHKKLLRKINYD